MSDGSYTWWQRALAGAKIGGPDCPIHEGEPHCGFFRRRAIDGTWQAVAIFKDGESIVAVVDGKSLADPAGIWLYVCEYPIPEAWYRGRVAGQPWPDEDAAVTASLQAPAVLGHNQPPQDEADTLRQQIEAASANAANYIEINDDETAGKAQSARARLLELGGEADKKREAEKRPHIDAGRAIDARWKPLVDAAKATADKIRAALSAHETRKAKALAEAKAKADAEAAKAVASGKPPPPAPPPPEAPNAQVRGLHGRAASVRTVKIANVIDQDAAYKAFREVPEVVALIAKLAQQAVTAGIHVDGVVIEEKQDVR